MERSERTALLGSKKTDTYGLGDDVLHVEEGGVSMCAMTLNLITVALGTGVLSQPWGLAGASLLPGLAISALVLVLNGATIVLLAVAAEKQQQFDLGNLLRQLPGRLGVWSCALTNLIIFLTSFGVLIGYLIVIFDSLLPFLPLSGPLSNRPFVIVASSVVILPFCFLDQQHLSFTSSLSCLVNINILAIIAASLVQHGTAKDLCWVGLTEGSITYLSSLMFSIEIQMCVLPMYQQLTRRTPERFAKCVTASFGFVFLLFASFSGLGYLAYGPYVQSNVLLDIPHSVWGTVTRSGMLIVIVSLFPLIVLPVVAPMHGWKQTWQVGPWHLRPTHVATVALTAASALVACFVTDLGVLNALNGAVGAVVFAGLAPGLAGLYFVYDKASGIWTCAMYCLIVLATLLSMLGLLFTDNHGQDLVKSCWWRV